MLMHSFSSIKIVRRHLHSFLKVSGVIPSNSMPLEKSKRATFYDQFNLTERRKIRVWQIAYRKHPERFVRQPPAPLRLPAAIWINPPPKVVQDPIDGPSAEKTSRIFDPQAICLPAPDALDGEIQSVATLNSIVQLSQNR
jgi:hypothetical protein